MEEMTSSERQKGIFKVTLVGSVVNLLLVIAKFIGGTLGRSSALLADAVHSLSDFLTDIIVIVFVKIAGKPQDATHDYGHGKYETLASIVIGILLLIVAIGMFVNNSQLIARAINGEILPRPELVALIVAAISILAKEGLYQYSVRAGKTLQSKALEANAWHHRSDALSSIGTIVGIGCAMFLGEKWRIMDPIAALVISALIFKVGIEIIKPAIDELLERSLPVPTVVEIENIMYETPGVRGLHHLRTRRIGNNIAIEVHLKMDGDLTLTQAHEIASEVERRIRARFGQETHIGIHMEPA
ncbi:MAG: cation transporter [Bacteroides sp.]|nr:cation transporter [Bacteroides sp.]MBD5360111.1 cation transporter [Bacteroides sp.]MBD5361566.1 cation transporter [Bacteroides sp.]MBD5372732.1 cation transporter [Bacteroides sp.]